MQKQLFDDEQKSAYLGLRHFSPNLVRTIRAALDNGVPVASMNKLVRNRATGPELDMALNAIAHMAANPAAGLIRLVEGSQYTFVEMDA